MQIKLHAALLLGIIYCLCDGNPTQAAGIPNITYTCDGNGQFTLDLTKVSTFSHFIITHVNITNGAVYTVGSNDTCTKDLTAVTNTVISLSGCDDHVYLYVMKHSAKLSMLVGGKSFHKYDLQCVLPAKGVTVRVEQSFNNGIPSSKTEVKQPDLHITMKFMKGSNETSTFKIGEGLKLDIHDNSNVTHKLKLKTCTSYSDGNHKDGTVKLFDSTAGVHVHETEIFGKIDENTTIGDIFVDLHAFRYPTSNTVYMQCMVYVCNALDTSCGTTKRRRRSTDNSVHAVEGSFSVIDTKESSKPKSSGQGTVAPSSMSVMSSVICLTTYLIMKSN